MNLAEYSSYDALGLAELVAKKTELFAGPNRHRGEHGRPGIPLRDTGGYGGNRSRPSARCPGIVEPSRCQRGVAHRVLHIGMP